MRIAHAALGALLALLGACAFWWVRSQAIEGTVGNADVAGILYNADVLLRSELPFRDSIEYKSPASFFLAAAVFSLFGRDLEVLRAAFSVWMFLGGVVVYLAARWLYRDRTDVSAGMAAGLYWLSAGHFDFNYSSWMVPAYALSFAFYDRRPVGWLMARMTSDCERLSNILTWGLLDLVWGGALMLAMAGRAVLDELSGDGVDRLRSS